MRLYHFTRAEFERGGRDWFDDMDPRLLVLLDVFRHQWGGRVTISAHPEALGRLAGDRVSDHNFELHGTVYAADVQPVGMNRRADAARALDVCRRAGFSAFGLYPDWRPVPGLHLSSRPSTSPAAPATWGALLVDGRQTYVSLEQALEAMP